MKNCKMYLTIFGLIILLSSFISKEESVDKELLYHYEEAIKLSEHIMNKHNIYDMDGSDEMCDYINHINKIKQIKNKY